jgi:glyoxylase I family protein
MNTPNPAPPPAKGLRLNNFAVAVSDLKAMTEWYETRLGFVVTERGRFDAVGADYAMIEAFGFRIELVSRPSKVERPVDRTPLPDHLGVLGFKSLVLETDDLAAATDALAQHGVEMLWGNQPFTATRHSTMLRDLEGNLIHIFGPVTPGV